MYKTVDATKSLARSFFGLVVPVQKAVHEQASAAAKGARRIRCETRRWCGDRATPPESTSSKKGGRVLGVVRWLSAWEAWWCAQSDANPSPPDNRLFTGYFHENGPVLAKSTRI